MAELTRQEIEGYLMDGRIPFGANFDDFIPFGANFDDFIRSLAQMALREAERAEAAHRRRKGGAMSKEEAIAWLAGERSTLNYIAIHPNPETVHVRVAEADLAMMQQAYWVLRAHKEGLLP